jgi:hypothetical protein
MKPSKKVEAFGRSFEAMSSLDVEQHNRRKTMLKKCKCEDYRTDAAKYQNEKYGKGVRVHNPLGGKNRGNCRCTVCGDEKPL